jgi:CTP synthase (UTP-ammonia lyase)
MAKFNTATMKSVANLHKGNSNSLLANKANAVLTKEAEYSTSYDNAEATRNNIKITRIAAKKAAKDAYTATIAAAKLTAKEANTLADTTYEAANKALTNETPLKLEALKLAYQEMVQAFTPEVATPVQ